MPNSSLLPLSTFFIIFFFVSAADSFDASCKPSMCGDTNISYPFWKLDSPAVAAGGGVFHCGYPGFGVDCSSDNRVLWNLSRETYFVENINYTDYTFRLIDADLSQTCPRARQNVSIEKLPLEFPRSNLNLTFYFNCSGRGGLMNELNDDIECMRFNEKKSFVFVKGEEPGIIIRGMECDEVVEVTVVDGEIDQSGNLRGRFADAMNKGFDLNWKHLADCALCEESDGQCGMNKINDGTENFLCLCKNNSTHPSTCQPGKKRDKKLKVIIGVSTSIGTLLIVGLAFILHRHYKKTRYSSTNSSWITSYASSSKTRDLENASNYYGVQLFTYSDLEKATNHFDSKKQLGDGGFGSVYLGKLRDGRQVAVKRLYENNYRRVEQFINEVEILARIRHQNLVTLYGCTSYKCQVLLLVYEYIQNGTLADHLHKPGSLSWTTRMSIAVETANALAYLHASEVVHRDVKTNNILLDQNFSVKVADFGLSRLFPTDVTHVSTAPQGTPGYVDPEYHQCYQLTNKSDVYSFGVVLVELISSKPAVDITRHRHEINLSAMAINKIQGKALHELVDVTLGFESDYKVMTMITRVAELAFMCLQDSRDLRPTMDEVVSVLVEIQRDGFDRKEEADELDILEDDDTFPLKSDPPTMSPKSVTVEWISESSTSH
ncbi:LEAF RUST 10 DISEASE-RESISTANCE LOCUS RECEPTOR-LIKE PROTEIN KINASE-like 1.2 [Impatiens glandulifera]|uniref:LEAF RUST 10 DISEASE-RESISTANCE LOCUS RECEPTOR-LIKE PROTEIN KINASE-like 1.2 n=1 Tax=Impatiens glandulifera TaxID=253017 RepID=UPI001FB0D582|nr:LEAF RUST 10 DISEASE-RESISTANCE LOCUS RECEPTOR-LIKE PROTEIN KINASE-like 1.2 [Impatiens glandulifera]